MQGDEDTFLERLWNELNLDSIQLQAVATGEADIRKVNDEYKLRRTRIRRTLRRLGLPDPNVWPDLWLWYGHYKETEGLETYQARREFIIRLYQPLLEAVEGLQLRQLGTGLEAPETGWVQVDEQTRQLRERFAVAATPEDFRDIGLRCRDILRSLGRQTYDPSHHCPEGESPKKVGDAKGRLLDVVAIELAGEANQRMRRFLRNLVEDTWNLAAHEVHDDSASLTRATIVANATLGLVSAIRMLLPDDAAGVDSGPNEFDELEEPIVEDTYDDYEPDEEDLAYLAHAFGEDDGP
jgi:hypothetical protein